MTVVCGAQDEVAAIARSTLAVAGVAVHGQLSSAAALTFVVDPERVDEAVTELHRALVEGQDPPRT